MEAAAQGRRTLCSRGHSHWHGQGGPQGGWWGHRGPQVTSPLGGQEEWPHAGYNLQPIPRCAAGHVKWGQLGPGPGLLHRREPQGGRAAGPLTTTESPTWETGWWRPGPVPCPT